MSFSYNFRELFFHTLLFLTQADHLKNCVTRLIRGLKLIRGTQMLYILTSVWGAQHPNAGRNIQQWSTRGEGGLYKKLQIPTPTPKSRMSGVTLLFLIFQKLSTVIIHLSAYSYQGAASLTVTAKSS